MARGPSIEDLRAYLRSQQAAPPPVNVHISLDGLASVLRDMLPLTPDGKSLRTSERIAPYV